jgi:glyoxylase-like metal-dependent hydrolase (beta-lactamase superfamily II)
MRAFGVICMTGCLTATLSLADAAEPDRFADVAVKSNLVGGSVYMLTGAGGNMAVSVGKDGTLLVDDEFAPLAARIQAAIAALGGGPPKIVLNTHFHDDHVGGNASFGEHSVIIANEQVRYRLLNDSALPRSALPVVTYADRIRVQFNDDEIDVVHLPSGHTDGDSIVWFRNANVLHTGDLFFNGMFPFIDVQNGGGDIDGYIADVAKILEMVPADTRIIPGHGPLASVVELGEFHDMLKATVSNIEARLAAGESVEGIVANGLGPEWARFATGFISEEQWIRSVQAGVHRTPEINPTRHR